MRKCVFRKFVRNQPCAYGGKPVPVYDYFEGTFHQWGVDYEDFESGPGNYSVAIVEMPNGQIETPIASLVKFIDTPSTE